MIQSLNEIFSTLSKTMGKVTTEGTIMRKDYVVVPDKLKPGEYVLGWRWDAATGNQVSLCPLTFSLLCFE